MTHKLIFRRVDVSKHISDSGSTGVLELGDLPDFQVKRVYWLYDTMTDNCRGSHAHKDLEQIIFAANGAANLLLDNGEERCSVRLDSESSAIYIPSGTWRELSDFEIGTILVVLASTPYDSDDYIHDYQDFLSWRRMT